MGGDERALRRRFAARDEAAIRTLYRLSLIKISEPTRILSTSYAGFRLKKKKTKKRVGRKRRETDKKKGEIEKQRKTS